MSPFLFLLCTEGLHGLISNAASSGEINDFSLCRKGLKLTHLLFTDDNILFCRATIDECEKILNLLKIYERASSQKVNKNKTALFFNKSTLKNIWVYHLYLGMGKRTASIIYERKNFKKKLQGWKGKLLSQAGREVLIKSIIQAIPTFIMGCFKLPIGLCNDIESLVRKFW